MNLAEFIQRYWIQTAFTSIIAFVTFMWKKFSAKLKKDHAEQKSIKEGVGALLQYMLYQSCSFYTQKGYCSLNDRTPVTNMYNAYKGLGMNGIGQKAYEEFMDLPSSPPKKTS
jgi:hypothetical protein